jgi:hypothetical protein
VSFAFHTFIFDPSWLFPSFLAPFLNLFFRQFFIFCLTLLLCLLPTSDSEFGTNGEAVCPPDVELVTEHVGERGGQGGVLGQKGFVATAHSLFFRGNHYADVFCLALFFSGSVARRSPDTLVGNRTCWTSFTQTLYSRVILCKMGGWLIPPTLFRA